MQEQITMINQQAVFGFEDSRILFIIGKNDNNDNNDQIINVLDVRTTESIHLTASKPINDMTESEIINEAKRIKSTALAMINGY